jgi:hypothetical protein
MTMRASAMTEKYVATKATVRDKKDEGDDKG